MSLTLPVEEIRELTGEYEQPRRQLDELHAQGFWRARLSRKGQVILEREHYNAVCAGAVPTQPTEKPRPTLRPVSRENQPRPS